MRSMLIGGPGAWIPYPSHSLLTYLGPSTWMIMLDCRAERKLSQVCSEGTYRRVFERLWDLPLTVKHLVVQLGTLICLLKILLRFRRDSYWLVRCGHLSLDN